MQLWGEGVWETGAVKGEEPCEGDKRRHGESQEHSGPGWETCFSRGIQNTLVSVEKRAPTAPETLPRGPGASGHGGLKHFQKVWQEVEARNPLS